MIAFNIRPVTDHNEVRLLSALVANMQGLPACMLRCWFAPVHSLSDCAPAACTLSCVGGHPHPLPSPVPAPQITYHFLQCIFQHAHLVTGAPGGAVKHEQGGYGAPAAAALAAGGYGGAPAAGGRVWVGCVAAALA